MIDNRPLVTRLHQTGALRVAKDPGALPTPASSVTWDRVVGMLVGLAVGDALGNTSESRRPRDRRQEFGEITDYLPNRHAGGRRVGLPSDDTQLAFRTVEQLLEDGGLIPERLAAFLARERIFGIGSTVRAFLGEWSRTGDWLLATQESAGNGALMRIAPVILPHVSNPTTALWADAVLAGAVTHNDFASNAACAGFVNLLWHALSATAPVGPGFWLDSFLRVARELEGPVARYESRSTRYAGRRTTCWQFAQRVVTSALERQVPTVEACDDWYSGAYLLETVPSVLYLLERHGNDLEQAIVRAVNDTRDNDTVAAIVGVAVGALHGVNAIPKRWREGLLGRLGESDDGRIWALIEDARRAWDSGRSGRVGDSDV